MTPDSAAQLIRDMFLTSFWLAAPLLAIGFAAGIVMSLIQIVTSIQDSAFNAVPRLLVFLGGLLLLMPWMMQKSMVYATTLLGNLSTYGR